jgi:hypothetical protein
MCTSLRAEVVGDWEKEGFGLNTPNYGTDLSKGFPGCLRSLAVGTRMPITKITHTLVSSSSKLP